MPLPSGGGGDDAALIVSRILGLFRGIRLAGHRRLTRLMTSIGARFGCGVRSILLVETPCPGFSVHVCLIPTISLRHFLSQLRIDY